MRTPGNTIKNRFGPSETPSHPIQTIRSPEPEGLTRRLIGLHTMHIIDGLSRAFLAKRSSSVERAGDV
jgi:hypothetical protein